MQLPICAPNAQNLNSFLDNSPGVRSRVSNPNTSGEEGEGRDNGGQACLVPLTKSCVALHLLNTHLDSANHSIAQNMEQLQFPPGHTHKRPPENPDSHLEFSIFTTRSHKANSQIVRIWGQKKMMHRNSSNRLEMDHNCQWGI